MRIKVSEDLKETRAVIKVIGIGGAGGNAVNRMAEAGLKGVELIAANTDAQDLRRSLAEIRLQIGETLTHGLGVGGSPAKGREAALESIEQFRELLAGTDLVFVTAGMGGGTGTGAAPVVARLAKEMGVLTVGVVTRPFEFEGLNRTNIAEAGVQEMRSSVDTLLVIPNQRLMEVVESNTPSDEAFRIADDVLRKAIGSISDVITIPGMINMDMNDIRAVMKDAGDALIGMAEASGPGRALRAAKAAVESPLLENATLEGAKGLIVNVTGRKETLIFQEIEEAMGAIKTAVSPEATIKVGKAYDEALGDRIRITVIATGFPQKRRHPLLQKAAARTGAPAGGLLRRFKSGHSPAGPGPAAAGVQEDWNKPAYMRIKVRKLK